MTNERREDDEIIHDNRRGITMEQKDIEYAKAQLSTEVALMSSIIFAALYIKGDVPAFQNNPNMRKYARDQAFRMLQETAQEIERVANGAESNGAESNGAESNGAESNVAESNVAESNVAESNGAES